MTRTPSPSLLCTGGTAIDELAAWLARRDVTPLLIHGRVGERVVRDRLERVFASAGCAVKRVGHAGPVTRAAVARLSSAVSTVRSPVVIAVGGGRVIDAAKAAAHRVGVPLVTVPTSPATCAAVTSVAVVYREGGEWDGALVGPRGPEVCILDDAVLAAASDRLLAAGMVDALAKVREVRLACRRAGRGDAWTSAALALCDTLARFVDPDAQGTEEPWPPSDARRAELASVVVWLPGLIAGVAGEANKLAAAHAVQNALTWVSTDRGVLHGERVAFGILVQDVLDGVGDEAVVRTVRWFRRLRIDPSLAGVGCARYVDDPDPSLRRMLDHRAMRAAFPDVDRDRLARVVRHADALARDDAARVAS